MPSSSNELEINWRVLGSTSIWGIVLLGVIVGIDSAEADALIITLIVGWGLFVLFLLWRITRAVERIASENGETEAES